MILKLLYKNEKGLFNYIFKDSNKTFKESKESLNIIFEKTKPLFVVILDNGDCYINDRNNYLPVYVDNLVQVSPFAQNALPEIFTNTKLLSNLNDIEIYNIWLKRTFDCYYPVLDAKKIKTFFREFFINCEIDEELFEECILSEDEFDYEKAMEGKFIFEEIEFVQNQIEFILNRILINFEGIVKRNFKNKNIVKFGVKLSKEPYESEIEFLRQFIIEKEDEPIKDDDSDSSFFDRYDLGTWMNNKNQYLNRD